LSTPEAHAGSTAGVPRNSTSPPTMTILASDESEDEEPIDYHEPNEFTQEAVDPTFREDYEFPGTVKITVQDTIFWSVCTSPVLMSSHAVYEGTGCFS
jgi:hypothetical protein